MSAFVLFTVMLSYVANRVKALILTLLNLFKRVLCVFQKRRRKPSGDAITGITIDNGDGNCRPEKLVPWNSWDDSKPTTVEDHIEQYRKSLAKLRTANIQDPPPEPDFFNDMTPDINTSNSLKLNFHPLPSPSQKVTFEVQENFSPTLLASPELGEILDEEEASTADGWDADEDLGEVLKQQRMEERRKRSEMNQKRAHRDRFMS